MDINPVGTASLPPQVVPKQAGNNVNVNNKVNNPAVAPKSDAENDGDKDDRGVKKTPAVQPQESRSTVQQSIDKFA